MKELLAAIEKISGDVISENNEIEDIDKMIEALSAFAAEIGELVSTMFRP